MKARITHLKPSNYRVMPWKNGGGSTTELAIFPKEADVAGPFTWRLSLAQLDASGPFSSFPGFDRTIIQLSGQPMRLLHQKNVEKQLALYEAYPFPGEWQTEGVLQGGGIRDFNIMVDRRRASAAAESLHLHDAPQSREPQGQVLFLYAWKGTSVVESPENVFPLAEGDALLIDDAESNHFAFRGQESILLLVDITLFDDESLL